MSEQVENEAMQPETPAQEDLVSQNGSQKGAVTTLSPAVIRSAMWRHLITLQWSWNYERMQALGFLYSMLPVINAVYKDKAERIAAMKRHLVFYNTNPQVGSPPIFGASVALEAQREGAAVDSLKVGLMGPFAGIGDTIQAILYRPIVAVFAASLALGGSYLGPALIFLSGILWTALMIPLFYFGYRQGIGVAKEVSAEGTLTRVTEMVTIMGMIVIGGFVPSIMAAVKTPLTYVQHVIVQGKPVTETVALQTTLDKIIPFLLPVLFVAFAYWLLRGLKLSAVWVLIILAVIAFVCGAFGIL